MTFSLRGNIFLVYMYMYMHYFCILILVLKHNLYGHLYMQCPIFDVLVRADLIFGKFQYKNTLNFFLRFRIKYFAIEILPLQVKNCQQLPFKFNFECCWLYAIETDTLFTKYYMALQQLSKYSSQSSCMSPSPLEITSLRCREVISGSHASIHQSLPPKYN